jgi:hypothetical protein
MVSQVESLCPLLIRNNKFCQSINVINEELLREYGNELLSGSLKSNEFDGLQRDLLEFIHILHMAERDSVKEVIQVDIDLILAEIESLKDLLRNQFETKILWSRVAALKHNKSKYKKQRAADPFQITPNCYNLLSNDSNDDDDIPADTGRSSKSTTIHVRSDKKKNHKKNSVKSKMPKV